MDTAQKLTALRAQMEKQGIAGFLQPVHDEYMNEYPPPANRRVEWLCGFTGSAGTVVVLKDRAAFFTDGRYTLQAAAQMDGKLFEQHNSANLTPEAWIAKQLSDARVGYDARLYAQGSVKRMENVLSPKNITLSAVDNVVDAVWKDRPAAPSSPVFIHDITFSGEGTSEKRRRIAAKIKEAGAEAAIIAAPDSVNWLLNIRGGDIDDSPLALAAAIVHADASVELFIAPSRCDEKVMAHLGKEVTISEPSALEKALAALKGKRVLCDSQTLPIWYMQSLKKYGSTIVDGADPCVLPKAMKNSVELAGIRNAHQRDGAAVVKLLCWLDREIAKRPVTEIDVRDALLGFRKQNPLFHSTSFSAITGSGPNGAIVHYRVTEASNRVLQSGELFLLDSGGQYPDGTTDITRTIAVGQPTGEHKDRFTRVLKGHIAIASAQFPDGTTGSQLDSLARQFLWQAELDYDHGTGHGVGCFLNVHEGPQRIGKRGGDAPLKPGMIISNEPGYYKSGAYGIRIESLVTVKEIGHAWLGFETVTCAPIDTRLVEASMLTDQEKEWLNHYHKWVAGKLSPLLDAFERDWLTARCTAI